MIWLTHIFPALCVGCMFIRFSAFAVIGQILLRLGLCLSNHWKPRRQVCIHSCFGWERLEQNVKDTRQFRKLVWVEVGCCCSFLKVMYQWKKSYRKMVICLENLMYPWNTSRAKVKICRFPLHPRNSCKQLLSKCGTVFSTRICCSCFRCQC